MGRILYGDLDLTKAPFRVHVDGQDLGSAELRYLEAMSRLSDGAIVLDNGAPNRDLSLQVMVLAADPVAAHDAIELLVREANKPRNTLRYETKGPFGAPAILDTFAAELEFDHAPGKRLAGVYQFALTMPALPFARSVDPFTVTGVTSTGTTTTTINSASSTTGWSAFGGPLLSGGGEVAVNVPIGNSPGEYGLLYEPGSPVDASAFPLLVLKWQAGGNVYVGSRTPVVKVDGVPLSVVSSTGHASDQIWTTYVLSDASIASIRIEAPLFSYYGSGAGGGSFIVDNVDMTDVAPSIGTAKQKVTALPIPGSARTPATIKVSHETAGLGDTIVYTAPALGSGYVPTLSVWATTSDDGDDAANVSGMYWSVGALGETFEIPARLLPRGPHQLLARMKRGSGTGATRFTVTVSTIIGGVELGVDEQSFRMPLTSTAYKLVSLGAWSLPTLNLPETSAANVRVKIASSDGAILDDAWLFYLPDDNTAQLSTVNCGSGTPATGGPSNRLWLSAADVDRPYPACYVGTTVDGEDSHAPQVTDCNWSEHILTAGDNLAFIVTSGANDALVEVEGYARWRTPHPVDGEAS